MEKKRQKPDQARRRCLWLTHWQRRRPWHNEAPSLLVAACLYGFLSVRAYVRALSPATSWHSPSSSAYC
jgi:hypothetical protein